MDSNKYTITGNFNIWISCDFCNAVEGTIPYTKPVSRSATINVKLCSSCTLEPFVKLMYSRVKEI